jgi:hypothetical protein
LNPAAWQCRKESESNGGLRNFCAGTPRRAAFAQPVLTIHWQIGSFWLAHTLRRKLEPGDRERVIRRQELTIN